MAAGTLNRWMERALVPIPKHPWVLGSITRVSGLLRMKSSVRRWQRVPLGGCQAACNRRGGGSSVPAGTAVLVGDAPACRGLSEAAWPLAGTYSVTDPCLVAAL